jgi:hypothetical protein
MVDLGFRMGVSGMPRSWAYLGCGRMPIGKQLGGCGCMRSRVGCDVDVDEECCDASC